MPVTPASNIMASVGRDIVRKLDLGHDLADAIHFALPPIRFEISLPVGIKQAIWFPDNLDEIDIEQWPALVRVSKENRFGVAWAPRADILYELLAVESASRRDAILEERQTDILTDCETALQRADHHAAVHELVEFTIEAIAAAPRFPAAAQALATNALETGLKICEPKSERLRKLKEQLSKPVDEDPEIGTFRLVISGCGIPPSYRDYKLGERDSRYSRNGTAHCANTALYTRLNTVKAITLATSWLLYESHEAALRMPPANCSCS